MRGNKVFDARTQIGNLGINELGEAESLMENYLCTWGNEDHLMLNMKTGLFIDILARESGMKR